MSATAFIPPRPSSATPDTASPLSPLWDVEGMSSEGLGLAPASTARTPQIVMPRTAALVCAILVFGVTAALGLLGARAGSGLLAGLPALLPLIVAAAAVGVGRLIDGAPRLGAEWLGPVGYVSAAPAVLLLFVSAADQTLAMPGWLSLVTAGVATLPFLLSAFGPRRFRAALRPRRDEHARSGALWVAAALGVLTYLLGLGLVGGIVQTALVLALVLAALRPRGLADAGGAWGRIAWLAFGWGAAVFWAVAVGVAYGVAPTWLPAAAGVAAALPLALLNLRRIRA